LLFWGVTNRSEDLLFARVKTKFRNFPRENGALKLNADLGPEKHVWERKTGVLAFA
jgi:hypothetical protein